MKIYLEFCERYSRRPLNPSITTILAYLEFLARRLCSPKSVSNYWASVKLLHAYVKAPFTNVDCLEVQLMLKAISNSKRHVSTQKLPLSKQQLTLMCRILDTQHTRGLVLKNILLFGFYAFLRASNLCPEDSNKVDPTRDFLRKDVHYSSSQLVITVKWAKNMQNSLQQKKVIIPKVADPCIDPVSSFKKMCTLIPATKDQHLFTLPHGLPLTISRFRKCFRLLCLQINIDPDLYSAHSLRRGGASHAKAKGASDLDIQRHGVWASSAYKDYLTTLPHEKSSVFKALTH